MAGIQLTEKEEEALGRGLKFCYGLTETKHAILDTIIAFENALNMNDTLSNPMDNRKRESLRKGLEINIHNYIKSKHKIDKRTNEYRKTILNLKKLYDVHIMKSDKGNTTVIMTREEYSNKMEELLQTGPYKMLKEDPTNDVRADVRGYCSKLLSLKKIDKQTMMRLSNLNTRAPVMYGSPKIHKPNVPLRPIVSSYQSPTQNLSKYLHEILKPLVGNTDLSTKNSSTFVQSLRGTKVKRGEILISYDATSLFTSVPIKRLLKITKKALEKDENLSKRTKLSVNEIIEGMELCLTSTYFQFRGTFYEQLDGMAMGSPLSTIGADIFMEAMEQDKIQDNLNIKFYKRFVDDIFMIIRDRQKENTLNLLNSFDAQVQFTYEVETNNTLPFLDTLIEKTEDGNLKFRIYRKPTHTDKYIDWYSVHPRAHKISVVNSLVQRAINICEPEYLEQELLYITNVLAHKNNYPKTWVQTQIRRIKKRMESPLAHNTPSSQSDEKKPRVILPYVKGLTENVARLISIKLENPIGYIRYNRMSDLVGTHKDKAKCSKCGVYKIECKCGHIYIGETSRDLKIRLKEHKDSTRLGNVKKSAIAEHVWENKHEPDHCIMWDNAKLIVHENRFQQRKIQQAMMIRKAKHDNLPLMNRKEEEGVTWLPNYYDSILFELF